MEELLDELKEEFMSYPTAEEFFEQQIVPLACFGGAFWDLIWFSTSTCKFIHG